MKNTKTPNKELKNIDFKKEMRSAYRRGMGDMLMYLDSFGAVNLSLLAEEIYGLVEKHAEGLGLTYDEDREANWF